MRFARAMAWFAAVLAPAATAYLGCAGTPPCEFNSDCVEGYCLDGECRRACVDSALDCPKNHFCNAIAQCEPADGGAGAASAASGPTSVAASTGGSASTGSGTGAQGLLEKCAAPSDCDAPWSCQPMTVGGVSRCTRTCSSDADCMVGTRCIDRGGKFCLGDDVGRGCAAPSACNYGCLTGPKYCTAACSSGADCPAGFGCMAVGNPPTKVCVRASNYCDSGNTANCIVPAACDLSPAQIIGGCTLACTSSADCPQRAAPLANWTCNGTCQRPPDVVGSLPGGYSPVEYFCDASLNPVALCNDAQHIDFDKFIVPSPPPVNCNSNTTTPGSAGDACVDSCRYQGGCPFGFACVGLGNVASERIGLCLPVGAAEPGSPCTRDRDCAFGYCSAKNLCSRDCTVDGACPGGLTCVAVPGPTIEGQTFRRCE